MSGLRHTGSESNYVRKNLYIFGLNILPKREILSLRLCKMLGHPENRVFAGCEGNFSHKNY
jgi:hypothetical protein